MPLEPGLYRLAWRTLLGEGAATVSLDGGEFRSLDGPAFAGRLHAAGDAFTARLTLADPGPVAYAYGRDRLDIDLSGRAYGARALLFGRAPQAPGLEIEAELVPI